MFIKEIAVQNFRQLKDIKIDLEEKTSLLAGPNNSGKTSLILLLKRVLSEVDFHLKPEDFNVYDQAMWEEDFTKCLTPELLATPESVEKFRKELEPGGSLFLPQIRVNLRVDGNDSDDISKFAEFLLDLNPQRNSFYFVYRIELSPISFIKALQDNSVNLAGQDSTNVNLITSLYCESSKAHIYFCDESYETLYEISDQKRFHSLFNFKYIPAARFLEDDSNKKHVLSSELISLVKDEKGWQQKVNDLSNNVFTAINKVDPSSFLKESSAQALNTVIHAISDSNGGHTGELSLNTQISESDIHQLINSTTQAQYTTKGSGTSKNLQYTLSETSQGLGYSNLVYLHTEIEAFIKSREEERNKQKVNVLIVEEPESHMHPKMQYVFANQLVERYNQASLQGLITTHSTEIVRGTDMESIRVIREETSFNSKVYDLSAFVKQEISSRDISAKEVKNFKTFYQYIGISELIFADAAILFEGDTERLYLKHIINNDVRFKKLKSRYIAYIQVGGAYAQKYEKILKHLRIKSLIITDIDYKKDTNSVADLLKTQTTNGAILDFYKANQKIKSGSTKSITMDDIYKWFEESTKVICKIDKTQLNGKKFNEDLICLTCQLKRDQYTRTLEAAMLSKLFSLTPFQKLSRQEWEKYKVSTELKFYLPNAKKTSKNGISLIDILESTAKYKTDFMCSVILANGEAEEMLPKYIEEGLKWLMM